MKAKKAAKNPSRLAAIKIVIKWIKMGINWIMISERPPAVPAIIIPIFLINSNNLFTYQFLK